MRNSFLLIFLFIIFFSAGCSETKKDEEPGEEEKKRSCGNGVIDEGEECDQIPDVSCSKIFSGKIGPAPCNECKIDSSKCVKKLECDIEKCNGNGVCTESIEYEYMLYCECFEGHIGYDCSVCMKGYHFDIDGKCIKNENCTLAGCVENSTCEVVRGQAKCICNDGIYGDNCDECKTGYYFEDGQCKGVFCSNANLKCKEFEKCSDSFGKPVCVCSGGNQNPDDCSECLPGYDWMNGYCADEAYVPCVLNPSKPENSFDVAEQVLITYTEETGWTEPAYCDWKCMKNTIPENGKCRKIEMFYSNLPDFPFGFNSSDSLIAGNIEGDVIKVSSEGVIEKNSYGIPFINGRIGADGNLYFMTAGGYGVINSETGNHFIFQRKMVFNQLTLSRDGTVFYGDSYFNFPDLVYVSDSFKDRKAVTITDYKGNTLTVYQEGAAVYMSMDRQILWSKSYSYFDFSLYPAFGTNDIAFLPCYMELKSQTCGIAMALDDGSLFEPMTFSGYSAEQAPSIAIDNDYRKFISDNGVLKILDSDNTIMYDTSSIFPQSDSSGTIPPVVTDTGYVYFSNNYQILAFRRNDNVSWTFDLNKKPVSMVHNDGKLYVFDADGLYVFYAPGKAEGKWPQMLHDAGMTGSYTYIPEFDIPSASELSLPADEAVFDHDTVVFKWTADVSDPEIKYTLLLRDSSGYDKVYAGPQKGLSTATVEGLISGTYEWRVVSQDLKGALNVSEARIFTIQ